MIAFSRTVPNQWGEHDKLAKTRGGMGIHAAVLDRDFGPLLQVQKLLNSIKFAQTKGHTARLTAAELEMMNLTGDGNGIDLVTMPQSIRNACRPRISSSAAAMSATASRAAPAMSRRSTPR